MYINEIMLVKHFEGEKCYAGISALLLYFKLNLRVLRISQKPARILELCSIKTFWKHFNLQNYERIA